MVIRSLTEYAAFCLDAFPAQMAATLSQVGCTLSFTAVPRIDQVK